MGEVLDVVVIGAGSTGLGISYFLKREAREHKVLDGGRIGETWRTQRWDSFRLNSPTIRSVLPGDSYRGPDPWGAITHHEFVCYLEDYAERHCLPVSTQTSVKELTRENGLFRLTTAPGVLLARNVVIATGDQNRQVRPPEAANLPVELRQVDSSAYRNAAQLEHGAVLVVGSGQSGGQIAEDLALAGRVVFLATSRNGRWVRRYRGGNILNWLTLSGFLDVPRKELVLPSGKVPARALVGATHTISLQSLSAQGVVLLGRFRGVENDSLVFGDDLHAHMRFADEVSVNTKRHVDEYIERAGLDAPPAEGDPAETVEPRIPDPLIRTMDWRACGIRSVVWCTGFTGDFSWVHLPGALNAVGQPVHADGVGAVPGLYFAGLDFGSTRKSGTIPALAEEAARLVVRLVKGGATHRLKD
ncbi:FAD dependent pyridine nucleotide-disulfide oxidoreductase protein [Rhizobium gallicum]|uniref:FAD dependent pyridine nucleotide-disulfide oxidoreductase protein n=1 Tax=Rhizobium gallicum TaxID=56730 RepID=A0A1L5NHH5_9HYPH|nr:NAD(P)/FAD-dependent oxidoreductase [Rhizobium gallicum]APO67340.1 FAD dependent pyridine nucleotide-disulfide oxidoreductase protein [Rhizobium gallicum]